MANRLWHDVETIGRQKKLVQGSFAPDTANPPTTLRGDGFSVVRTSQGLFTVTFDDSYPELESADASLQLAAAAARFIQIGAYNATAKTLQIRVTDATGAVQDVAANANNRVNFCCVFDNGTRVT
jgi:hypothetical protein